ncbi:protein MOR1 [Tanacetum coccineum]
MAGFLSRLVTKICRVLTTKKTVDDDEVAPRRNEVRTYKVPDQYLLTTRTMDDEDAPGLKAVLNFHVPDEVEPEDVVDPDEMTTLESRLGSLIQHNTITRAPAFKVAFESAKRSSYDGNYGQNLTTSNKREKLLGYLVLPFKQILYGDSKRKLNEKRDVYNFHPQEVDIPGSSEKNVQVEPQVIEVVSHIASTTTKFPKKCVVLCIGGICERVVDIKTRAQAIKCLTTFSEAMGTYFIFERTSKIMKEHKNPKVLSEGLLWMVFAVDDFSVAHLKLKDVFDFCKDIGLQSSSADATIIATIKLIGVLHKFVGSDIKALLSDVMPALLSVVEAECEKNPFEGAAAAPKKTIMASGSVSFFFGGGLDSLPREDNSRKITPELLKGLECSNWKVNEHCTISHIVDYAQMRLESIEAVNKIVEEANKRIQPTGTVKLFGALRSRLYDSNKNLIMATLTSINGLESAMGPAIEKSSKGIVSDIVKCIGENKKHMRECITPSMTE